MCRNARCGLCGFRVGEASNPGPPQTRNRPKVDVAEDIFASLEHDLSHIDSDDEPLVQGGSDSNVVPRLDGCSVLSERPEDGNCFCCFPECSCSDPHEEASFAGSSWRHGSSTVTGFSCSTRVQFQHTDVPRTTTMRPRELPGPCCWCKLVNCQRPDKHWKELP